MLWQGAKWRILKNFNVQNEECHNYDDELQACCHHLKLKATRVFKNKNVQKWYLSRRSLKLGGEVVMVEKGKNCSMAPPKHWKNTNELHSKTNFKE